MSDSINNRLYFKNLDSIRFIAAFMVYLGHGVSPAYKFLSIEGTFWERLLNTVSNGGTGVSIFFVLSGFLITYLLITEHELTSKISLKNFYIRRTLRIWPLYFLVVAFSFFIYPNLKASIGMNNQLGSNVWYHLAFLSNFDVIRIEKFDVGNFAMSQNITWSVSIEEQFYLFWPMLFVLLPKRFWGFSIFFVIISSLVFRIIYNNDNIVLYYHTLSVLLDLGIGGLMAYSIKKSLRLRNFLENTTTLTHIVLFLISASLLLWQDSIFSFEYGNAISRIIISLSFVLIIASQAITKSDSRFNLGRLGFANKWGKYTYGIYLLHPIAITVIDIAIRRIGVEKTGFYLLFSIGVIGFILTLILSWVSYRFFEIKFLRLKDKFTTIETTK